MRRAVSRRFGGEGRIDGILIERLLRGRVIRKTPFVHALIGGSILHGHFGHRMPDLLAAGAFDRTALRANGLRGDLIGSLAMGANDLHGGPS